MKILIVLCCIFPITYCFSQEPNVRLVDGKIVFKEGYTPTSFELNLATSGIKFENFTDFAKCRDEKDYLEDKIDDLKISYQKKIKFSLSYLKSENAKR